MHNFIKPWFHRQDIMKSTGKVETVFQVRSKPTEFISKQISSLY